MKYHQITIHAASEAVEAVSERLMAFYERYNVPDPGIEIFDPGDIESLNRDELYWDYIDEDLLENTHREALIRVYYSPVIVEKAGGISALIQKLQELLSDLSDYLETGSLAMEQAVVDEDIYLYAFMEHYQPFGVGKRIHIIPSFWQGKVEALPQDIPLFIDPGLAFGTGTHETTSLCMEYLERLVEPGTVILDIGCGSGILGILAAKLGAGKVIMSDFDPMAVEVARENIQRNQTQETTSLYQGDLTQIPALAKDPPPQADLIVANIMADVIIRLGPLVLPYLKPEGSLIASGIILEREAEVIDALAEAGYRLISKKEKGNWAALCLKLCDA